MPSNVNINVNVQNNIQNIFGDPSGQAMEGLKDRLFTMANMLANIDPSLAFELPTDVSVGFSNPLAIPPGAETEFDTETLLAYILDATAPGATEDDPVARPIGGEVSIRNDGDKLRMELAGGYVVEVLKSGSEISIADAAGNKLLSNWDPHWFEQVAGQSAEYATDSKRNSTVAFGDWKLTKITTFDPSKPDLPTYNDALLLTGANGEIVQIGNIFNPGSLTASTMLDRNLALKLDLETDDGNKIWFNPSSGSKVEYKDAQGNDFYRYLQDVLLD